MNKFIIWIVHHPDVIVSFNKNPILNIICVRMQLRQGRLTIEYAFDDLEYKLVIEDEDHVIKVMNNLYDKLINEKEEK